jgi:hypothetical protein
MRGNADCVGTRSCWDVVLGATPAAVDTLQRVRRGMSGTRLFFCLCCAHLLRTCRAGRTGTRRRAKAAHRMLPLDILGWFVWECVPTGPPRRSGLHVRDSTVGTRSRWIRGGMSDDRVGCNPCNCGLWSAESDPTGSGSASPGWGITTGRSRCFDYSCPGGRDGKKELIVNYTPRPARRSPKCRRRMRALRSRLLPVPRCKGQFAD